MGPEEEGRFHFRVPILGGPGSQLIKVLSANLLFSGNGRHNDGHHSLPTHSTLPPPLSSPSSSFPATISLSLYISLLPPEIPASSSLFCQPPSASTTPTRIYKTLICKQIFSFSPSIWTTRGTRQQKMAEVLIRCVCVCVCVCVC